MIEVSTGSLIISALVLTLLFIANLNQERSILPTPIRMNGKECNTLIQDPNNFSVEEFIVTQ